MQLGKASKRAAAILLASVVLAAVAAPPVLADRWGEGEVNSVAHYDPAKNRTDCKIRNFATRRALRTDQVHPEKTQFYRPGHLKAWQCYQYWYKHYPHRW
jgi:hypothetical protein